jgi:hypothetical protein
MIDRQNEFASNPKNGQIALQAGNVLTSLFFYACKANNDGEYCLYLRSFLQRIQTSVIASIHRHVNTEN